MLKSLSIRNVVLIDKLDLDLQRGFTVFSGETGAGKSILLDSVGLLLGQRADISMIRNGCDKLSVSGTFEVADKTGELTSLLHEHDIDFDGEIIISRSLTTDGRGKIFLNDQPVTQKLLKEVGAYLVEIHGQFDNQGLLNPATHLKVLDSYGAYDYALKEMYEAFWNYKKAKVARETAENEIQNARLEEESLRHWVDEFSKIKPCAGELDVLEQKRQEMMNAEKLLDNFSVAYKALNNPNISVRDSLRQAQTAISHVNALLHDKYSNIYEVLDTALVNIEEANEQIESASHEISLNQSDIDAVEERLFCLKDLARKHHTTVEELPEVWRDMENRLENLEHGESDLLTLQKAEKQAYELYIRKARTVHEERVTTASDLDRAVMIELPDLKMEKAKFVTQITVKPEDDWNADGMDDVCFTASTNPGTPAGALNKIASGGELARFMLALKVNLAQTSSVDTMIFDEVDTGVGGATAQAVGDRLAKLGEREQVFVVTHSPQVAARGSQHFKVVKTTENNVTTTDVYALDATAKLEEVARMLSGEQITDEARAAAQVLIGG